MEKNLSEQAIVLVALQMVVVEVLKALSKADPKLAGTIMASVDNAANNAELASIQLPGDFRGLSSARALEVVEEIRGFIFD